MPPVTPPTPGPAAPQGQAAPQPGQSQQQQPFGSSPLTGPTQNKGYEAQGLQRLAFVVAQLGEIVPLVGAASDIGGDILDALRKLAKHVPSGSVSDTGKKNAMQELMMKQAQMGPQIQQMRQQAAQPGQQAA